jgi:hypothetical protein
MTYREAAYYSRLLGCTCLLDAISQPTTLPSAPSDPPRILDGDRRRQDGRVYKSYGFWLAVRPAAN